MEKKSTDGQEQLENGRFIPKLRRTIRKYKSRIIFILILILIPLKIYMPPMSDILPDADSIEYENLAVYLGVYMIVQCILEVLILLLIILLIISFWKKSAGLGEKSTSLEKKNTSFGKKSDADQDELEEKRILRKIFLPFEIFLLSGILFAIGMGLGANSTLEIILCLPCCAILTVIVLFFVKYYAEEFVKEKGDTRGVKIVCVLFFVLAVLAACFFWFNIARNLIASFDPPSIELTQLSAEHHPGHHTVGEPDTLDKLFLFGVDSDGKEHEFVIDEDEWYRLTKVGEKHYVASEESYDWIIEFDDDVRLVGHHLTGWAADTLVDFEIIE